MYSSQIIKSQIFRKIASLAIAVVFLFTTVLPPVYAQQLWSLPPVGTLVHLTPAYQPILLKGLKVYPDEPFNFDFIVDAGDEALEGSHLEDTSTRIIKYFLASLAVPEEDLWVNLSPYEQDRIIPDAFGQTEMGRDLLAQDYILKQLTASLMYPETELGQAFWTRVREEARERFGTTELPLNTLSKVWIVPARAEVYENKDTVFVTDAYLKVMLEKDYMAQEYASGQLPVVSGQRSVVSDQPRDTKYEIRDTNDHGSTMSDVVREILIPAIEKEVNTGQTFAQLRQIYYAMILAAWYKEALKENIINTTYSNQRHINGVHVDDPNVKDKIYKQYVEAFRAGVYNYIKEEYDPSTQSVIPRQYASGGFHLPVGPILSRDGRAVDASTSNGFIIKGQMKKISPSNDQNAAPDFTSRHEEWEAFVGRQINEAGITPQQFPLRGIIPGARAIEAHIVFDDLGEHGSYYFESAHGMVIVINRDFYEEDTNRREEAVIHEVIEIYLTKDKGYSQKDAHIIASAIQRYQLNNQIKNFKKDGLTYDYFALTDYDLWQMEHMDTEALKALKEEYEFGRERHHQVVRDARKELRFEMPNNFLERYEDRFYEGINAALNNLKEDVSLEEAYDWLRLRHVERYIREQLRERVISDVKFNGNTYSLFGLIEGREQEVVTIQLGEQGVLIVSQEMNFVEDVLRDFPFSKLNVEVSPTNPVYLLSMSPAQVKRHFRAYKHLQRFLTQSADDVNAFIGKLIDNDARRALMQASEEGSDAFEGSSSSDEGTDMAIQVLNGLGVLLGRVPARDREEMWSLIQSFIYEESEHFPLWGLLYSLPYLNEQGRLETFLTLTHSSQDAEDVRRAFMEAPDLFIPRGEDVNQDKRDEYRQSLENIARAVKISLSGKGATSLNNDNDTAYSVYVDLQDNPLTEAARVEYLSTGVARVTILKEEYFPLILSHVRTGVIVIEGEKIFIDVSLNGLSSNIDDTNDIRELRTFSKIVQAFQLLYRSVDAEKADALLAAFGLRFSTFLESEQDILWNVFDQLRKEEPRPGPLWAMLYALPYAPDPVKRQAFITWLEGQDESRNQDIRRIKEAYRKFPQRFQVNKGALPAGSMTPDQLQERLQVVMDELQENLGEAYSIAEKKDAYVITRAIKLTKKTYEAAQVSIDAQTQEVIMRVGNNADLDFLLKKILVGRLMPKTEDGHWTIRFNPGLFEKAHRKTHEVINSLNTTNAWGKEAVAARLVQISTKEGNDVYQMVILGLGNALGFLDSTAQEAIASVLLGQETGTFTELWALAQNFSRLDPKIQVDVYEQLLLNKEDSAPMKALVEELMVDDGKEEMLQLIERAAEQRVSNILDDQKKKGTLSNVNKVRRDFEEIQPILEEIYDGKGSEDKKATAMAFAQWPHSTVDQPVEQWFSVFSKHLALVKMGNEWPILSLIPFLSTKAKSVRDKINEYLIKEAEQGNVFAIYTLLQDSPNRLYENTGRLLGDIYVKFYKEGRLDGNKEYLMVLGWLLSNVDRDEEPPRIIFEDLIREAKKENVFAHAGLEHIFKHLQDSDGRKKEAYQVLYASAARGVKDRKINSALDVLADVFYTLNKEQQGQVEALVDEVLTFNKAEALVLVAQVYAHISEEAQAKYYAVIKEEKNKESYYAYAALAVLYGKTPPVAEQATGTQVKTTMEVVDQLLAAPDMVRALLDLVETNGREKVDSLFLELAKKWESLSEEKRTEVKDTCAYFNSEGFHGALEALSFILQEELKQAIKEGGLDWHNLVVDHTNGISRLHAGRKDMKNLLMLTNANVDGTIEIYLTDHRLVEPLSKLINVGDEFVIEGNQDFKRYFEITADNLFKREQERSQEFFANQESAGETAQEDVAKKETRPYLSLESVSVRDNHHVVYQPGKIIDDFLRWVLGGQLTTLLDVESLDDPEQLVKTLSVLAPLKNAMPNLPSVIRTNYLEALVQAMQKGGDQAVIFALMSDVYEYMSEEFKEEIRDIILPVIRQEDSVESLIIFSNMFRFLDDDTKVYTRELAGRLKKTAKNNPEYWIALANMYEFLESHVKDELKRKVESEINHLDEEGGRDIGVKERYYVVASKIYKNESPSEELVEQIIRAAEGDVASAQIALGVIYASVSNLEQRLVIKDLLFELAEQESLGGLIGLVNALSAFDQKAQEDAYQDNIAPLLLDDENMQMQFIGMVGVATLFGKMKIDDASLKIIQETQESFSEIYIQIDDITKQAMGSYEEETIPDVLNAEESLQSLQSTRLMNESVRLYHDAIKEIEDGRNITAKLSSKENEALAHVLIAERQINALKRNPEHLEDHIGFAQQGVAGMIEHVAKYYSRYNEGQRVLIQNLVWQQAQEQNKEEAVRALGYLLVQMDDKGDRALVLGFLLGIIMSSRYTPSMHNAAYKALGIGMPVIQNMHPAQAQWFINHIFSMVRGNAFDKESSKTPALLTVLGLIYPYVPEEDKQIYADRLISYARKNVPEALEGLAKVWARLDVEYQEAAYSIFKELMFDHKSEQAFLWSGHVFPFLQADQQREFIEHYKKLLQTNRYFYYVVRALSFIEEDNALIGGIIRRGALMVDQIMLVNPNTTAQEIIQELGDNPTLFNSNPDLRILFEKYVFPMIGNLIWDKRDDLKGFLTPSDEASGEGTFQRRPDAKKYAYRSLEYSRARGRLVEVTYEIDEPASIPKDNPALRESMSLYNRFEQLNAEVLALANKGGKTIGEFYDMIEKMKRMAKVYLEMVKGQSQDKSLDAIAALAEDLDGGRAIARIMLKLENDLKGALREAVDSIRESDPLPQEIEARTQAFDAEQNARLIYDRNAESFTEEEIERISFSDFINIVHQKGRRNLPAVLKTKSGSTQEVQAGYVVRTMDDDEATKGASVDLDLIQYYDGRRNPQTPLALPMRYVIRALIKASEHEKVSMSFDDSIIFSNEQWALLTIPLGMHSARIQFALKPVQEGGSVSINYQDSGEAYDPGSSARVQILARVFENFGFRVRQEGYNLEASFDKDSQAGSIDQLVYALEDAIALLVSVWDMDIDLTPLLRTPTLPQDKFNERSVLSINKILEVNGFISDRRVTEKVLSINQSKDLEMGRDYTEEESEEIFKYLRTKYLFQMMIENEFITDQRMVTAKIAGVNTPEELKFDARFTSQEKEMAFRTLKKLYGIYTRNTSKDMMDKITAFMTAEGFYPHIPFKETIEERMEKNRLPEELVNQIRAHEENYGVTSVLPDGRRRFNRSVNGGILRSRQDSLQDHEQAMQNPIIPQILARLERAKEADITTYRQTALVAQAVEAYTERRTLGIVGRYVVEEMILPTVGDRITFYVFRDEKSRDIELAWAVLGMYYSPRERFDPLRQKIIPHNELNISDLDELLALQSMTGSSQFQEWLRSKGVTEVLFEDVAQKNAMKLAQSGLLDNLIPEYQTHDLFKPSTAMQGISPIGLGGTAMNPNIAMGQVVMNRDGIPIDDVKGRILIASYTGPQDDAKMKESRGVITTSGGTGSHAVVRVQHHGIAGMILNGAQVTEEGLTFKAYVGQAKRVQGRFKGKDIAYTEVADYKYQEVTVRDGDFIMIDGHKGEAYVLAQNPSENLLERFQRYEQWKASTEAGEKSARNADALVDILLEETESSLVKAILYELVKTELLPPQDMETVFGRLLAERPALKPDIVPFLRHEADEALSRYQVLLGRFNKLVRDTNHIEEIYLLLDNLNDLTQELIRYRRWSNGYWEFSMSEDDLSARLVDIKRQVVKAVTRAREQLTKQIQEIIPAHASLEQLDRLERRLKTVELLLVTIAPALDRKLLELRARRLKEVEDLKGRGILDIDELVDQYARAIGGGKGSNTAALRRAIKILIGTAININFDVATPTGFIIQPEEYQLWNNRNQGGVDDYLKVELLKGYRDIVKAQRDDLRDLVDGDERTGDMVKQAVGRIIEQLSALDQLNITTLQDAEKLDRILRGVQDEIQLILRSEDVEMSRSLFNRLQVVGRVAARSSGLEEDSEQNAMAGLRDSVLNIRSTQQLFDSILTVWSSGAEGILVQEMINVKKAFVATSSDPTKKSAAHVSVTAAKGQVKGIVDQAVKNPDIYTVLKPSNGDKEYVITVRRIGRQEWQVLLDDENGGVKAVKMPVVSSQKLTDEEILAISAVVDQLARYLGYPIEVEGGFDADNRLVLLQVRPETTLPKAIERGKRLVFSEQVGDRSETPHSGVDADDPLGGIDFRSNPLNINRSGKPMRLNLPLEGGVPMEGLTPVINQIIPITNLPLLLGVSGAAETFEELSYSN